MTNNINKDISNLPISPNIPNSNTISNKTIDIKDQFTPNKIEIKNRLNPRRRTFQDGYTSLISNTTLPILPIHIVPQSNNIINPHHNLINNISNGNSTTTPSPFNLHNHSNHNSTSNHSTPVCSPFSSPRDYDERSVNNKKIINSYSKITPSTSRSSSPGLSINEVFKSSPLNSPAVSPTPNIMRMKSYDVIRSSPSQLLHSNSLVNKDNHSHLNSISNEQLQSQLSSFRTFCSIQPIESTNNSPVPITQPASIFKSSITAPQPKSARSSNQDITPTTNSLGWDSPIIPWGAPFATSHKKTFSNINLTEDEKFELAEKEHQELMKNYSKIKKERDSH